MIKSENFYNRLTLFYPVIDFFLKPQKKQFFTTINAYPHGRLLEVGVGNGAHFKYYTTHDITAIDTSQSMLNQAARHQKENIQLLQMNGEILLFPDDHFDYVTLSHVIAVVEDPDRLLAEVYRVLKPNGKVFILNHFTPNNGLKYLDKAFEQISRLFHFKSVFHIASVSTLEKFRLQHELNAGLFSYFKMLIYEKSR